MAIKCSSNVADLSAEQRQVLESVIGQPLRGDQVVHWAVTAAEATANEKATALVRLQDTFARIRRNLDEKGVSQQEWHSAVDEAVQHVRSQRGQCESS